MQFSTVATFIFSFALAAIAMPARDAGAANAQPAARPRPAAGGPGAPCQTGQECASDICVIGLCR
ncbi:hypothetical protein MCOR27_005559 [Pyricularia oryzae]|uniref:Uncharacterized protein n=1 Tax=Pyricularia grisea TaxID=148305 RepID=A0ABQ8N4L3_PYRGI|nr:hypothetical protein MCOR01_010747 [Pyricularia oryzae]KAI6291158.1 hypothetical protein MCOR33_010791 [Pyricularia grisea]KAI6252022.1 hypothetical protein MCOR19_011348 [Pyricularia oryzae]KAI6278541.1 hypothetical protein MCOR27_005559 [Pyricularia oryzae]KAI6281059.1 hypothetical protein MCOR26_003424 [Pyricularia oryzae]